MLVPYATLTKLSEETFDNLIREYLLQQIEDGSFANLSSSAMQQAISRCKNALEDGELVVEFSEHNSSIAIRQRQDVLQQK